MVVMPVCAAHRVMSAAIAVRRFRPINYNAPLAPGSLLKTWIALLRGINVVGRRKLLMKDLAAIFERGGFESVRTYIQSGNVVFESARGSARTLSGEIGELILKKSGFKPHVIVLSVSELERAVRGNPFPQADADHKSLHLFFLSGRPARPDLDRLAQLKVGREAFELNGAVFYLYTPRGFPQCALHDKVERFLGVDATARNWRTANQLLAMSRAPTTSGERHKKAV
jgi:uncharacterized protein (DUF1697 family)